MTNTPFKSMKNGLSLGSIAGGPAFDRERGGSETISTFNIIPCFSLTQPARNPDIILGNDVTVWEGK